MINLCMIQTDEELKFNVIIINDAKAECQMLIYSTVYFIVCCCLLV